MNNKEVNYIGYKMSTPKFNPIKHYAECIFNPLSLGSEKKLNLNASEKVGLVALSCLIGVLFLAIPHIIYFSVKTCCGSSSDLEDEDEEGIGREVSKTQSVSKKVLQEGPSEKKCLLGMEIDVYNNEIPSILLDDPNIYYFPKKKDCSVNRSQVTYKDAS